MSNAKTFQDWAKEILPVVQAAADGAVIEREFGGVWYEHHNNTLGYGYTYRVKPKTIRIGEYDVPEPMREIPVHGTSYYAVDTVSPDSPMEYIWVNDPADNNWLRLGIVHSTRDAAVLHAEALLSLTEVRN